MLYSALKRGAPLDEINIRKRSYDEAFFRWGVTLQSDLLRIRRVAGDARYSPFEGQVEGELVPMLGEIDSILTKACDARRDGKMVGDDLKQGKVAEKLNATLDKSYKITNSFFETVSDTMGTGLR